MKDNRWSSLYGPLRSNQIIKVCFLRALGLGIAGRIGIMMHLGRNLSLNGGWNPSVSEEIQ